MTKFAKDLFSVHGGFIHYGTGFGADRKFVARTRLRGEAPSFISFLIKNFTVEEYFAAMDENEKKTGADRKGPLTILMDKGYLQPHIKRWLREANLPLTQAGFRTMIDNQRAARELAAKEAQERVNLLASLAA
jgi:hypothetical protein